MIPGSQGTKSYIVKGTGNIDSFQSCSHGAGRKMSRMDARRTLNLKAESDALDKLGILHSVHDVDNLDEAPGSYKDIRLVMEEQKELIVVVDELIPLANVKAKSKPRKKKL